MKFNLQRAIYMLSRYFLYAFFLQMVFINLTMAVNVLAQYKSIDKVLVTFDQSELTLNQFFKLIEAKTDFQFSYDMEDIDGDFPVILDQKRASVEDYLKIVARQAFLAFRQVNNSIDIKKTERFVMLEPSLVDVTITGTVSDEIGEPIPGVTISVLGTATGTASDLDGKYSLTVPEGSTLVFSFIGFEAQTIEIGDQSVIDVTLLEDMASLDEVVVVGYGTQKRKDITGSVASVSAEDFADIPMTNIGGGLIGRIPGLDIVSTGAGAGAENKIQLRGQRSFTASNDPLIILDGSPYYGSMNDINPYDIKSVDVLKDASSTAIYGARGANGVIIITTKRGTSGPPKFILESFAGPQMRYGKLPYADAIQYAEIGREAYRAIGGYPDNQINPEYDALIFDQIELEAIERGGTGLDYQDMLFQNGFQQKHQLSVMGGSEAVKYNFSGSYFNQEGILPGEVFDRYSMRTNLDFTLSSKITAGASILLNYTLNQRRTNGALNQAFHSSPLGKLYEDDGSPRFTATLDGLVLNPLADYIWDSYRQDQKGWGALINSFAQIQLLPGLTYRVNLGTNFKLDTDKESAGYYSLTRNLGTPTATVFNSVDNLKLYESILTFNRTFKEDHQLTLTGVHGFQSTRIENSGAGVSDLPYELSRYHNLGSASLVNSVTSDLVETFLLSYAGRVFYGYKSKYMLTLSIRADGASQFSPDHKWGYFPSAAIAYRISDESFMKWSAKWLTDLKFRVSYGVTGNQGISPYLTQGGLARTLYSWNEAAGFGYRPIDLVNRDLKWETTAVNNFGMDFEILQGKIQGNLDIYSTDTYDLLMYRNLPITSGYDEVLQNVGRTNNKGFEVGINTVNINRKNFYWNTSFTYFRNRTSIVELYNGKVDDIGNRWFIGEPIDVFFDFKKVGIWQQEEKDLASSYGRVPGQIKVLDLDNDGAITDLDRMVLGSREPDFIANITNSFTHKNWDLSFQTYIRWGGMTSVSAFSPFSKKRYNKMVFDYWTPNNPTNEYPRPNQLFEGGGLDGSTLTYRDASLISLRQVSLGFSLPVAITDKLNLTAARVYLSGENLAYWTKSELRNFNMKADFAGDITPYPAIRSLVGGINVSF